MSDQTEISEDPRAVGISQIDFAASARGSLDAHRLIRDSALRMARDGTAPFDQAFAVAEAFARLASSIGHAGDRMTLAGILFHRAAMHEAVGQDSTCSIAQGLAQIDAAADDGDEAATVLLEQAADVVPHEMFGFAQMMIEAGATA